MNKEKLRDILNYAGSDKAEYEKIENELYEHDRKRLEVYSVIVLVLLAAVIMFSLFNRESGLNYKTYIPPALAMLMLVTVLKCSSQDSRLIVRIMVYVFTGILFFMTIYIGTFNSREQTAGVFLAMLLGVPLLFVIKPWKIILAIVFYTGVFIFLCMKLKSPAIYYIDIVYALIFALAGSLVSFYVNATSIENLIIKNRMKELSEIDGLTGLRNRTAYEAQLKLYPSRCEENLCCIYIDANGLHEMNEKEGHFAGDRMLIKVAALVQETFGRNDSFRIGGDEYVAFVVDSCSDDVANRIKHITQEAEKNSYHISAGYSFADKDNIDIKKLIQEAEEVMYSVKAEYYKTIGNRRCR